MTSDMLNLLPLDARCALLTNIVWTPGEHTIPTLQRQHLWVQFPLPITTSGLRAEFSSPLGLISVETAEDDAGTQWRVLAEVTLDGASPQTLTWEPTVLTNIRVRVVQPAQSIFPLGALFHRLALIRVQETLPPLPATVPLQSLVDCSRAVTMPFSGLPTAHINERLGLCHDRPQTDRVHIAATDDEINFSTPVFSMTFSKRQALVTQMGWDTLGQGRQCDNLLSTGHTRGAFPVVMRDGQRLASESCGGEVEVNGRTLAYRHISPVPELTLDYTFAMREHGFSLDIQWDCTKTFYSSELAALRIPFDLYTSVVNVLAMPETSGPSGLITLPLVMNAPNYGIMRVTAEGGAVLGRISPLRTLAELWLDIIPGAVPQANGLFEMPAGHGRVTLNFELTKIFPFGNTDKSNLFTWWEMPPSYSFADRDNILGALPNAWLNGLSFRPDIARFANNSVADSAAACALYYADIAAYTPMLADELDPRQFIRVSAEQLLRDADSSAEYSDWRRWPTAAISPLDCAWLYVASTGDWAWAERMRDGIHGFSTALQQLEDPGTGLVVCRDSGRPEDAGEMGYMGSCWCDSIRSGHLDSYSNAHAYRALNRAAELLERVDFAETAGQCRAQAVRLQAQFVPTFYDAESKQIAMWVDTDGRRYGFRSHFHLGAAVALGVVPDELARELLTDYLTRLQASGFTHYEWGLPIFLDPVPAAFYNGWKGKGVDADGSDQLGVYMNGAVHTHQTYYLLQALYHVGMRREANELFMRMTPLARTGGLCGGLHSGLDWRHPVDGRPSGYEGLLAEQYHYLLAAITGYLACELTIDGLTITGQDTERQRSVRPNFARMR